MSAIEKDLCDGFAPGPDKKSGGHDHRSNKGDNRTPAQKNGDSKRKKS